MRRLTKGIYYHKDKDEIRLWHDCPKYKDRDSARVEMDRGKETGDSITFSCPYCEFEYEFDKNLNLA